MALKICNFRIYVNVFETTFLKTATQSFVFDFRSQVVQNEGFSISCISLINCFENEVTNVRYTILDNSNVLRTIIFPSSVCVVYM